MIENDATLIEEAVKVLRDRYKDSRHTVAAVARLKNGEIVTAMNSQHFSGFVCAEMALLSQVINEQESEIDTIVSVHNRNSDDEPVIVNPCGKCRQLLLEYAPSTQVLVSDKSDNKKVSVLELLPFAYIQSQTKRIWDESKR